MSDYDGAVQRPAGPEDTESRNPVGMADAGANGLSSSAESAVGMEDASEAGVMDTGVGTPPADTGTQPDAIGEERGLTEDQVLGRVPLPETES